MNNTISKMFYWIVLSALSQCFLVSCKGYKEPTKPPAHKPPVVVPVDPSHQNPIPIFPQQPPNGINPPSPLNPLNPQQPQNPINPQQPSNPFHENPVTPAYQPFTLNFPPTGVTMPADPFHVDFITDMPNNQRNRNKDMRSCFSYDRRYQAETLQDAIMNFPDLTMNNWRINQLDNLNTASTSQCYDDQCRACANTLLQRLELVGVVKYDESERIRKNMNLGAKNAFLSTQQCPRLQLERRLQLVMNSNGQTFSANTNGDINSIVDKLSREGNQNWLARHKRETDLNTLGRQYNVKCVKRGEPLDQQTLDYVGLCSMCWVWRQLPDDYFPQYINELVCDSDTKCLSGWGLCQQGTKNVDVLQKTESPPGNVTWRPLTLQSKMLCNCEVKAGSALHNLVNG